MDYILQGYQVNEATWFYLSLLLIVAVFFRFNRLWSLRNVDLILLLSISPGLLLLNSLHPTFGYAWLFVCTGLLLLRLFLDPIFKRRPLLEQNLNASGLAFLCFAAFAFQVTKVATEPPAASTVASVRQADELLRRKDGSTARASSEIVSGPATTLITATTAVAPARLVAHNSNRVVSAELIAARIIACLSHLAVIVGLIYLGKRHLGDIRLGVAMATLYLLLPSTAYQVSNVDHVLPAALVIWSLAFYYKPMIAGGLMGLACGTVFFPAFLLPLWVAFYGRQGAIRFVAALGIVASVLIGTLALTAADSQSFIRQMIGSIDWSILQFQNGEGVGFWAAISPVYRLPVMAVFLVGVVMMTIFPRRKSIEHLMAHSAAIVVATQLWYPQHGGIYVMWYLPLVLGVVFRPRLAHLVPPDSAPLLRVARTAHTEGRQERTFSTVNRQQLR
jgi:hypothetical protein